MAPFKDPFASAFEPSLATGDPNAPSLLTQAGMGVLGLVKDWRDGAEQLGLVDPRPQATSEPISGAPPQMESGNWLSQLRPYQPAGQLQLTPDQIRDLSGKTVSAGGSRSFSTQTVKGRPADIPFVQASKEIAKQSAAATKTAAEAEAGAAEKSSKEMGATLQEMGEARQQAQVDQYNIRQEIEAKEQRINQAREQLAAEKIDPNRYWSNQTVGQKIASGIAVALAGYFAGHKEGKPISDRIVNMFNREVERDIALQRDAIARKGDKIKGDENSLSWLYKRLGSAQEAERALRDSLTQSMGLKLQQIALAAQSPVIKANAIQVAAKLRDEFERRKHDETVAAFDKTVKTSNVTKQDVPLLSLIQQQLKAKATDPTAIKPLTDNPGALKEVNQVVRDANVLREAFTHFYKEYERLDLSPGATGWAGREAARVNMLKKLATETYLRLKVGNVSEGMFRELEDMLAGDWTMDKDVKKRVIDAVKHADIDVKETLNTWGLHYDVTPYIRNELARRQKQNALLGIPYLEFRQPEGNKSGGH